MRSIILSIALILNLLNVSSTFAAAAAPSSTQTRNEAHKEAQSSTFFVLNAALYEAIQSPTNVQRAAQLVRDMIFDKVPLPFNPMRTINLQQIRDTSEKKYAFIVASAYLLAFAFPKDDFWKDFKDTLSARQKGKANPEFDNSPETDFLAWYVGLIKLFQMNLEHTLAPYGGPYTLAETFENISYTKVSTDLFSGLNRDFPISSNSKTFQKCFVTSPPVISADTWVVFENNGYLSALDNKKFKENLSQKFLEPGQNFPIFNGYIESRSTDEVTVNQIQGYLRQPLAETKPPLKPASGSVLPASALGQPIQPPTTITLKKQWREALAGGGAITYKPTNTIQNFTIRGNTYKCETPRGLTATAFILYENLIYALAKYLELNPNVSKVGAQLADSSSGDSDNEKFRNFLNALDLYFGAARFHQQICHTITTKISASVTNQTDRRIRDRELINRTVGTNLPTLDDIGFPINHGNNISRMFRPEYELPDNVMSEMAFFRRSFNLVSGIKPNYHVEQLPEIEFGAMKNAGSGPKAFDVQMGLCNAYGAFSGLLNKEIGILRKLDAQNDPNAKKKWQSFFEQAQKGGCADEYFKNLQEWIITDGSQSAAAVVIDPSAIQKIVDDFISVSFKNKDAMKSTLQKMGYLDANGDLSYDLDGPLAKAGKDSKFATEQLQIILKETPYKGLIKKLEGEKVQYNSFLILSAVVGYDF